MNLITDGTRKARKPHNCWYCNLDINMGEQYYFQKLIDDDIYEIKMHPECNKAFEKMDGQDEFNPFNYWIHRGVPIALDEGYMDDKLYQLIKNEIGEPHLIDRRLLYGNGGNEVYFYDIILNDTKYTIEFKLNNDCLESKYKINGNPENKAGNSELPRPVTI